MPTYRNPPIGLPVVTIDVSYHNNTVGPGGTHSIQYRGQGAAAVTHHGYLDYSFDHVALHIHTMTSTPEGGGLGALLLFEAAQRAVFHGVNRIKALNVAATARGFYLRFQFHPSQESVTLNNAVVATPVANPLGIGKADFAVRLHLARNSANWDAERGAVQQAAFQAISGVWI